MAGTRLCSAASSVPGCGNTTRPSIHSWIARNRLGQPLAQAIAHSEDVALDLRGRIANVGGVGRTRRGRPSSAARCRPARTRSGRPSSWFRAGRPRRPDHQVVDVAGAARQLQTVDQHVVLRAARAPAPGRRAAHPKTPSAAGPRARASRRCRARPRLRGCRARLASHEHQAQPGGDEERRADHGQLATRRNEARRNG